MKSVLIWLCLLICLVCLAEVAFGSSGEIDETAFVDRVIDGDTFDVTSGDRIRLADIDAPESGEPGYYDAKNMLTYFVGGKTVYLDIDDVYRTDRYGRLVCVVYVKHNSTHYLNVNMALLVEGVAVVSNYVNEFDPYVWTTYVHQDAIPEFASVLALTLVAIATSLTITTCRRRTSRKKANA